MRLSQKLATLCGRREWDRNRLAEVVPHVSESTVYNWFKGKSRPDLASALLIAREFGVPLEWLADDALDAPPVAPDELSYEQKTVLAIVAALGLTLEDAIRRLNQPAPAPQSRPAAAAAGRRNHESA